MSRWWIALGLALVVTAAYAAWTATVADTDGQSWATIVTGGAFWLGLLALIALAASAVFRARRRR